MGRHSVEHTVPRPRRLELYDAFRGGCEDELEGTEELSPSGTRVDLKFNMTHDSAEFSFALHEAKTSTVMVHHITQMLNAVTGRPDFPWDEVIKTSSGDGKTIWAQAWSYTVLYATPYVIVSSMHIFFYCERVDSELQIQGPYLRPGLHDTHVMNIKTAAAILSRDDLQNWTFKHHCEVLGSFFFASKERYMAQANSGPYAQLCAKLAPYDARLLPVAASNPRGRWAAYKLFSAPTVRVRRPLDIEEEEQAVRLTGPLNTTPDWLDYVLPCLLWFRSFFVNNPPTIQLHRLAGHGVTSTAWRGIIDGLPVILKVAHRGANDALQREWAQLSLALPPTSRSIPDLPIPHYYGLFRLNERNVIISSDHGIGLNQICGISQPFLDEMLQSLAALRAAGLDPEDVGPHNAVWDGHRVTIIDFAVDGDVPA
ncbi:hypothetical protein C8Q80DRAFT_193887 [Daedaleopsis nitida]|nr:hypothetical protein C8Q80DRAFT_193887 [Daedaleopsis nitida]